MTYVKQAWIDGTTPADAAHMLHIEDGIAAAERLAVGTSFPAAPTDGQVYVYAADAASGVYWPFVWNQAAGKWRSFGAPPLTATVAANENLSNAAYTDLTTVGPSIVLPFAGDYDVGIQVHSAPAVASEICRMGFAVGATPAADPDYAGSSTNAGGGPLSVGSATHRVRKVGISGTITAKYKTNGGQGNFRDRTLFVWPVQR